LVKQTSRSRVVISADAERIANVDLDEVKRLLADIKA
jgi:hypothetical protein